MWSRKRSLFRNTWLQTLCKELFIELSVHCLDIYIYACCLFSVKQETLTIPEHLVTNPLQRALYYECSLPRYLYLRINVLIFSSKLTLDIGLQQHIYISFFFINDLSWVLWEWVTYIYIYIYIYIYVYIICVYACVCVSIYSCGKLSPIHVFLTKCDPYLEIDLRS